MIFSTMIPVLETANSVLVRRGGNVETADYPALASLGGHRIKSVITYPDENGKVYCQIELALAPSGSARTLAEVKTQVFVVCDSPKDFSAIQRIIETFAKE